jgi:hypothetical protein
MKLKLTTIRVDDQECKFAKRSLAANLQISANL